MLKRREFTTWGPALLVGWGAAWAVPAQAGLFSEVDASAGIKLALERGVLTAVGLLGRPDGFLGNPQLRIPLPGFLKEAAQVLKFTGQQKKVDELVTAMNRAAEAAVPQAQTLLVQAVKAMTVEDAMGIVQGGDTSATDFFVQHTRAALVEKFLPVVHAATDRVSLAAKYNVVAGKASELGLLQKEDASIESHVTHKALDGLYRTIGEQERLMRKDPLGTGSALLKKVFG